MEFEETNDQEISAHDDDCEPMSAGWRRDGKNIIEGWVSPSGSKLLGLIWGDRSVANEIYSYFNPPPSPPPSATDVLRRLSSDELADFLSRMPIGFEERYVRDAPILAELTSALRSLSDRAPVERELDALFEDFRPGELFVHAEVVSVLLIAVHRSNAVLFSPILDHFAAAKAPEFARLARLARRLVAR